MLEAAIAEAERLLGGPLKDDLVDPDSGEFDQVVIVTDNGPAYKSDHFARFIMSRPELAHVRTTTAVRRPTASSNASTGRSSTSISTTLEIDDAWRLTQEVESYRQLFNEVRPHEHLVSGIPLEPYLTMVG